MSNYILLLLVPLLAVAGNQDAGRQDTISRDVDKQDRPVICKAPRPEICTMEYLPVCGNSPDNTEKTYASGCNACSHSEVVSYRKNACDE